MIDLLKSLTVLFPSFAGVSGSGSDGKDKTPLVYKEVSNHLSNSQVSSADKTNLEGYYDKGIVVFVLNTTSNKYFQWIDADNDNTYSWQEVSTVVKGDDGRDGVMGNQIDFGVSFPNNAHSNDLFIFTSAVLSGLNWIDSDGVSTLTSASIYDVAKYSGSSWMKVGNIKGRDGTGDGTELTIVNSASDVPSTPNANDLILPETTISVSGTTFTKGIIYKYNGSSWGAETTNTLLFSNSSVNASQLSGVVNTNNLPPSHNGGVGGTYYQKVFQVRPTGATNIVEASASGVDPKRLISAKLSSLTTPNTSPYINWHTLLSVDTISPDIGVNLLANSVFQTLFTGGMNIHVVVGGNDYYMGVALRTTHVIPNSPTNIVSIRAIPEIVTSAIQEFSSISLSDFNSYARLSSPQANGGTIGIKFDLGISFFTSESHRDDWIEKIQTNGTITNNPTGNIAYSIDFYNPQVVFKQETVATQALPASSVDNTNLPASNGSTTNAPSVRATVLGLSGKANSNLSNIPNNLGTLSKTTILNKIGADDLALIFNSTGRKAIDNWVPLRDNEDVTSIPVGTVIQYNSKIYTVKLALNRLFDTISSLHPEYTGTVTVNGSTRTAQDIFELGIIPSFTTDSVVDADNIIIGKTTGEYKMSIEDFSIQNRLRFLEEVTLSSYTMLTSNSVVYNTGDILLYQSIVNNVSRWNMLLRAKNADDYTKLNALLKRGTRLFVRASVSKYYEGELTSITQETISNVLYFNGVFNTDKDIIPNSFTSARRLTSTQIVDPSTNSAVTPDTVNIVIRGEVVENKDIVSAGTAPPTLHPTGMYFTGYNTANINTFQVYNKKGIYNVLNNSVSELNRMIQPIEIYNKQSGTISTNTLGTGANAGETLNGLWRFDNFKYVVIAKKLHSSGDLWITITIPVSAMASGRAFNIVGDSSWFNLEFGVGNLSNKFRLDGTSQSTHVPLIILGFGVGTRGKTN